MKSNSENVANSKRRKKEFAVAQFGGKCQNCGYDKCVGALDFHHIDPASKADNPAHIILHKSWENALPELEKCVLLCSNCHREHHYLNLDFSLTRFVREVKDFHCEGCGGVFKSRLDAPKFCSMKCNSISQRKVKRPTKEELSNLIITETWVSIGKTYGVSDNAVRKWARSYGILQ